MMRIARYDDNKIGLVENDVMRDVSAVILGKE
jgi:hypothetical protein